MVDRSVFESRIEPVFGGSFKDHVLGVVAAPVGARTPQEIRLDASLGFDTRQFITELISTPARAKSNLDYRVDASLGFSLKDHVSSLLPAPGGSDIPPDGIPYFAPDVPVASPADQQFARPDAAGSGTSTDLQLIGDALHFGSPTVRAFIPKWKTWDAVPASFTLSFDWTSQKAGGGTVLAPQASVVVLCYMSWPADSLYGGMMGGAGVGYIQAGTEGTPFAGTSTPQAGETNTYTRTTTKAAIQAGFQPTLDEFTSYGITLAVKSIGYCILLSGLTTGESGWVASNF